MPTVENSLTFRLFIGFPITSELKMEMNHNSKWKEIEILKNQNETGKSLQRVHFDDKEYLGHYLDCPILSLKDLPVIEENFHASFKEIFPEFKQDRLSLQLFSQVFVH